MNLRESAMAYESSTTKNITELATCPVDLDMKTKTVHEGQQDEFSYNYVTVDGEDYRIPDSVQIQLKAQLEANPGLKNFRVTKTGTGMNTTYTVIPLTVTEEVKG